MSCSFLRRSDLARGARPHLDIAFFTRTKAEVLNNPDAGEALGERLAAVVSVELPAVT